MKRSIAWLPNGKMFRKEKKTSRETVVKPQEFIAPVETEVESLVADAVALEETLLKEDPSEESSETSDTDLSLKKKRGKKKIAEASE